LTPPLPANSRDNHKDDETKGRPAMLCRAILTDEEVRGGKTFVLKLWDAVGVPTLWVETLRGEAARRWYDIYRRSDWDAVRAEAGAVFHHRVSEGAAHAALASGRCSYIHTLMVETGELSAPAYTEPGLACSADGARV
jgi:hypothetical protein